MTDHSKAAWKIGINVPWNASWTAESSYEVRNCRWANGNQALWCPHKPGEGQPIFAKPHMVRQRRSVIEYRCTVCGEKTPPSDRWTFPMGQTHVPGWAVVTTEAPVHWECAARAVTMCPRLRSLGRAAQRWVEPDAILRAIVGGEATDRDFGLNLAGRAIVGHLKFAWKRAPFKEMAGG